MPANKSAQPRGPRQAAGETTDPELSEGAAAGEPPSPESPAEDAGADPAAPLASQLGRVRHTQRTISRHSVDEEIVETIVEDLPAAYSPPASGYPATVG